MARDDCKPTGESTPESSAARLRACDICTLSPLPRSSRSPAPRCRRNRTPAGSRSSTARPWTAGRSARTPPRFAVVDGAIVVNGPRAHLYYVGPVGNHDFKNFEFKADVMTTAGSNSGIYFHTAYQEGGWPSKGYEVQVNNSHTDPKRTAGLYSVQDNMEAPAKDDEWFTMQITVQGKHVTTSVNGKTIVGLHRARRRRSGRRTWPSACCRAGRSRCRATTRRARCSSRTSWSSRCPDGRHQPGYQTTRGSSGARR